ncbi:FAD-dependent oxidoreductase [Paraburkholderia sp. RL17-373-BIF-A]|uniref:FAD-dependent oxidoreductase n=1 Tax=Paraburkholderia sp. RL17-373-BIF-A TaxID=3031629 RepID=UPI0038B7AAAF
MTTRNIDYLLLGGGATSAAAARALRREDAAASIVILCSETLAPYQRPQLTKGFLGGTLDASQMAIHAPGFYAERHIELLLGARAVSVNLAAHTVHSSDARAFHYRKLLIATGASARVPDLPNATLRGVHCLHSVADAAAIREAATGAGRAVVLGASFVGLEVAASLRALGLTVTVIERGRRVLPLLGTQILSDYFMRRCAERGIDVLLDRNIREFVGSAAVEAVVTDRGESMECDLVVVAIGVTPNCEFLRGSGLVLEDGIVVDEFLRTSDPDVFAAGDVASFPDPVFGVRRRIEHWDNAIRQGRLVARNMVGGSFPYQDVSMFYGDVFDISYNFLGRAEDITQTVERGTLDSHCYSLLYLKNDVLQAMFSVGRTAEETAAAEELIRRRVNLHASKARLHDEGFLLDTLPSQTVLILQGGGALGAFECGAVRALEERGVHPDVVAAVSIGAFNGAIVASHPGHAAAPLAEFWRELSISLPATPDPCVHQALLSWYVLCMGVPNFFQPRWWNALPGRDALIPWWTSLYDPTPITRLITRYVDFEALGKSRVRLLLSAVDVATGERRIFDSYVDRLTPQHLLASGSLPPGLPWTTVDGKQYWDGGIVSNSPLDLVIERCGSIGKRVFAVDLFSGTRAMPANLLEVMLRRDEIVYTDRVRNDLRFEEYANDFSELVQDILWRVDPLEARRIRQNPHYIRLMGNRAPIHFSRIELREGASTSFARDYDFSAATVQQLQERGYQAALAAVARSRH